MNEFVFRPYQRDLIKRTFEAFKTHRRVVMQCPTGGGKTACAAEIIRRVLAKGKRVAFFAHLDQLVGDTHDRLTRSGIYCGYVQAGRPSAPMAHVQVCSLQTLAARGLVPHADLVILDECHRANARTVRDLLEAYPSAKILGLTATPQRSDGSPLIETFDHIEQGPTVKQLIADGFLVPSTVYAPSEALDSQVIAEDPCKAYQRLAEGRRAVVFCRDITHASDVWASFAVAGIPCEMITGETSRDERADIRKRLYEGTTRCLVGVNVFTEGFDCPPVDCVIIARKIGHIGQWLQAIGRGLRPSPETGKADCIVIDLFGAVHDLGLPDQDLIWSIDGKPKRAKEGPKLRNCPRCGAIFEVAFECPRCGYVFTASERAKYRVASVPLTAVKAEDSPKDDRKYVNAIARRLGRFAPHVAHKIAVKIFTKQEGREPKL